MIGYPETTTHCGTAPADYEVKGLGHAKTAEQHIEDIRIRNSRIESKLNRLTVAVKWMVCILIASSGVNLVITLYPFLNAYFTG